ncbi:MAG: hypothetical protein OEX19_05865 [Gammaproteobacteria bacterium]|nr:hypothetical protein [Gammaproteobacteria bacterium]
MNSVYPNPSTWWGSFTFNDRQILRWKIGPLTIFVRYLSKEWQITYERLEEFGDSESTWCVDQVDSIPEEFGNTSRYIFGKASNVLTVTPILADRPVISRPRSPFNLALGEETTLYVSTPLWVELAVGDSKIKLDEIAMQRPSDTWFGPSTREGELCYASSTYCRLGLEELPQRYHRAITPVLIRNQANSALSVERLNVPAPHLPLYTTPSGQLWTPKIVLTREEDGEMAALRIEKNPPEEARDGMEVRKPRKVSSEGVLIRAFNAMFN